MNATFSDINVKIYVLDTEVDSNANQIEKLNAKVDGNVPRIELNQKSIKQHVENIKQLKN